MNKKITAVFAAVALFSGFLFVDRGGISGNVIVGNSSFFNPLSLIGLVLVFCGIILALYSIKSR